MSPPADPPREITVRIKVPGYPDAAHDALTLTAPGIPIALSIGDLRREIQALAPQHPPPERQRLLYLGRALVDNDQSVADALHVRRDPAQTEYVLHLLVRAEQGVARGGVERRNGVRMDSTERAEMEPERTPWGMPAPHEAAHSRASSSQGFRIEGVGPNGQRFQYEQHTYTTPPTAGPPGLPPHFAPSRPPPTQAPLPSFHAAALERARENMLDRARENMSEMRRVLRQMREPVDVSEEAARTIDDMPRIHFHPPPRPATHPPNPPDVTTYLLSSPHGPQALLFSPHHGAYNGALARPRCAPRTHWGAPHQPPPPPAGPPAPDAPPPDPRPRRPPALLPLMDHVWLLLRVLIFAYFFLGTDLGWQRPLILVAIIAAAFWALRAAARGNEPALRRWWDGIVGAAGPAPAPTPDPAAPRRLLADRARARHPAWWRARFRPVERALALFVASLWPGLGEATVRARREAAERRRAEEEEEAARRAREEVAVEEADKGAVRAGGSGERDGDGREVAERA